MMYYNKTTVVYLKGFGRFSNLLLIKRKIKLFKGDLALCKRIYWQQHSGNFTVYFYQLLFWDDFCLLQKMYQRNDISRLLLQWHSFSQIYLQVMERKHHIHTRQITPHKVAHCNFYIIKQTQYKVLIIGFFHVQSLC